MAIRSYTRAHQMLDRALDIGRATFEPFQHLRPVREELAPPLVPTQSSPDPRRRTR